MTEARIISYCRIRDNAVLVNDRLLIQESPDMEFSTFLSGLYKRVDLNYPKFFKMDKLCKLGILATELMIRNTPGFETFPKDETALIFANHASSLESDRNHAATIANKEQYFPSPSVFVYTLPNIITGEIAIKYKITGENAFFVCEQFEPELMQNYSTILLQNTTTSAVICAWVNAEANTGEAFVYYVKNLNFKRETEGFQLSHNWKNIDYLYSTSYGSTGNHQEPKVTDH